jgi:3-isopropylmalate/(R)-2-methylmalate dehydratase large subunit
MGKTVAEKLISRRVGYDVAAGEIVIVPVDGAMVTDGTGPLAIKAFTEMGGKQLWDPARVSLVIDHAAPAPNERVANLHQLMRDFHQRYGGTFYDVGAGICHQLMVENGHVRPGEIFIGADSHTPTCGALNAFGVGVGSTDLAAVLLTGKIWLKVPETVQIVLEGRIAKGITAKDIILFLVGRLGIAGATYKAVEFTGTAVARLSVASRMTLANMSVEMGAKTGLVDPAGLKLPFLFAPVFPDDDAMYVTQYQFDVSDLRPQVALPNTPDRVVDVDQVLGQRIDQAFIGSCTNSRLEDLQMAAAILSGRHIHPQVRLIVAPSSRQVLKAALADSTAQTLVEAGATFITAGCGPCVGTHQGVPGDGEVIISTANRNFRGRMGNPKASIYLGSPALVAASALYGEITDPTSLTKDDEGNWEIL